MQRGRVELSGRRKHPVRSTLLGLWQQVVCDLFDFTLDILLLLLQSKSCPPSRLIPPWPLETILNWDCPLFPLVHPFSSSSWWWSNFAKLVPLKIATQNNKIGKKSVTTQLWNYILCANTKSAKLIISPLIKCNVVKDKKEAFSVPSSEENENSPSLYLYFDVVF